MIKFGIVGCGRVGKVHAAAVYETKGSLLTAICDLEEGKLKTLTKEFRVSNVYKNYTEMLENKDIDVINICTPNGLHADMAIAAIKKGKHVIIEKPMATSLEDARLIIETAKKYNVKATVVHQNRFNEAIQVTREALLKGRFGKLSYGTASVRWTRTQDYYNQDDWRGTKEMLDGVLMNQVIHTIDLLIWLMGPVKSVFGRAVTRLREIEMEDVGTAILEFESGSIAVVDGTGTIYPVDIGANINLFGECGTVSIGGNAANQIERWRFSESFEKEEQEMIESNKAMPLSVYGNGHKQIVENFVESIKENKDPYVSLEAGFNAVKVILAIYKSSMSGQPVYFENEVVSSGIK
ncbi:Gfo/Idh/MocA family protein [Aquibacillus salsiterrae]|uniref:Gfo/Idh/MocA family oxidoreductase n=1 Tax=Aquibacillus salsiterrae TaxID=2950439 RepID=A0A9X4AFH5_9BACI|nr:Gfo/Idh/MocA family oxidoreductase [Aquibacillus salsiterrae]MDC3416033.1 Gfo/Idh/MocA family oxidoreductase [Aquibacillus salsiterrae]